MLALSRPYPELLRGGFYFGPTKRPNHGHDKQVLRGFLFLASLLYVATHTLQYFHTSHPTAPTTSTSYSFLF